MRRLLPLICCLLLACTPRPAEQRALELYLARSGEPGLELPDLLPISHPLLLRQTLAGADTFRQELASWLRHPSLRLLDTRLLEIPRQHRVSEWARGTAGDADWILEIQRSGEHAQVQLRVEEGKLGNRLSGWTDLLPNEDLVLGMPLADGAGLLLRLPPAGAATATHTSGTLPESLANASPTRPFLTPPALVDGPAQLGRLIKYPPGALRDGLQGTVLVALLVDEQGLVRETNVVRGVRADLDSAAEASLKQARFTPAKDKQGPVSTWVTVPVRFKLAP